MSSKLSPSKSFTDWISHRVNALIAREPSATASPFWVKLYKNQPPRTEFRTIKSAVRLKSNSPAPWNSQSRSGFTAIVFPEEKPPKPSEIYRYQLPEMRLRTRRSVVKILVRLSKV